MARQLSLDEFSSRSTSPTPWSEGEKIPWDDPAFSARMLKEHLTQDHDLASRRSVVIDRQVEIIASLLDDESASVLDLGCGPGLYCQRLAARSCRCTGIDIGPASLAYARQSSLSAGFDINYVQGDIRTVPFPENQDLAMLLFGEFNVFKPDDALLIACKAKKSLKPDGLFIIEPSTYQSMHSLGNSPSFWHALPTGLFCEGPHVWLYEAFWNEELQTATERHFTIEEGTKITEHASSSQAYTEDGFRALLQRAGFSKVEITSWSNLGLDYDLSHFHVIIART